MTDHPYRTKSDCEPVPPFSALEITSLHDYDIVADVRDDQPNTPLENRTIGFDCGVEFCLVHKKTGEKKPLMMSHQDVAGLILAKILLERESSDPIVIHHAMPTPEDLIAALDRASQG